MKRTVSLLLCLMFLLPVCGCAKQPEPSPTTPPTAANTPEPTPEPTPFVFTAENFPRMNGSTSTVPLGEAILSELLGISREEAAQRVSFERTTQAYYSLIDGYSDILIVGEGEAEVLDYKEEKGFDWLRTPFSTEAFVFVVNENNPVDSITVEQARKIYTGEITNWAELGGDDTPIIPFQRNAEAGSQALMKKHIMQGTPMMEPASGWVVMSMGGLMEGVKSYDNSAGAIGYSVYYYAVEMQMAQGLKLLKLNGVEASPETIRSGEYPVLNPTYVIIDRNLPEDAPARILYDWLLSEEGQRLVAAEGYVSVMELKPERTVTAEAEEIGGRWEGAWNGLQPAAGGCPVSKYAGTRLALDWPAEDGCLYGLMTTEGEVLTPPVYSSVEYADYYNGSRQNLPVLILRTATDAEQTEPDRRSYENVYTVAAADLGWVYPEPVKSVIAAEEGVLLAQEDELLWLSTEGAVLDRWDYEALGIAEDRAFLYLEPGYRDSMAGSVVGGRLILRCDYGNDDVRALRLETGAVERMTVEELDALYNAMPEDYYTVEASDGDNCTLQRGEETITIPIGLEWDFVYRYGDVFTDHYKLFTADGTILPTDSENRPTIFTVSDVSGDVCICARQNPGSLVRFFRGDGSRLALTAQDGEFTRYSLMAGILGIVEDRSASYYRLDTEECVFRIRFNYEGAD